MAAISYGSFVRLRSGLPHCILLIKSYSMLRCAYQPMAYVCLDFLLTPCRSPEKVSGPTLART